mmetsp:Transcript_290/g.516  ORF Transcript_290/g.516 Transcript_290/m.516 type:complete len:104 (+) Transcript_290:989-1300(+)
MEDLVNYSAKCSSCKEHGHNSHNCPNDPNACPNTKCKQPLIRPLSSRHKRPPLIPTQAKPKFPFTDILKLKDQVQRMPRVNCQSTQPSSPHMLLRDFNFDKVK